MKWPVLTALLLTSTVISYAQDLEQDPLVIRAEQRLPKTIYIAPWQRVGEPLEADPVQGGWKDDARPLDRETFLRELQLRRQGYLVDRPLQPAISPPEKTTNGSTR